VTRKVCRFTQAEVSRVTKVAKAQGMAVELMPDGSIRIVPTVPMPVRISGSEIEEEPRIVF
jgi:hypothetical protein